MTITEFLKTQVSFLSGITQEQAVSLASQAQQLSFNKGQTVVFVGTTVEGLHVMAMGKVGVFVRPRKGAAVEQVAELGPGDVFGETSIIEMGTAGATIKASDDVTLIFMLPQEAFRQLLAENAEFKARAEALIAARKKKPSPPKPAS